MSSFCPCDVEFNWKFASLNTSNSYLHNQVEGVHVNIPDKSGFFKCLNVELLEILLLNSSQWCLISKQDGSFSGLKLSPVFVEPLSKSPDFNRNSHTAPHFESFFWIPVRKSVIFICASSWLQRCRKTFQNPWLWSTGLVWLLIGTMCPQTATKPELQKNGKRTFITSKLLSLPYC